MLGKNKIFLYLQLWGFGQNQIYLELKKHCPLSHCGHFLKMLLKSVHNSVVILLTDMHKTYTYWQRSIISTTFKKLSVLSEEKSHYMVHISLWEKYHGGSVWIIIKNLILVSSQVSHSPTWFWAVFFVSCSINVTIWRTWVNVITCKTQTVFIFANSCSSLNAAHSLLASLNFSRIYSSILEKRLI